MSGGVAYGLDEKGDFEGRCNKEMIAPRTGRRADATRSGALEQIHRHQTYTRSERAQDTGELE